MSEAPAEPVVSPPPEAPLPAGQQIVKREEKVEYRDQDGNLLNEEQVKELEGKVSFKTRYETRTRMVDAAGNEINPPEEAAGVAPPHPDVEGVDSSTIKKADSESKPDVKADESKEESIAKSDTGAAKPASEGNEATGAAQ
jgi:dolichyl-phosphate-mannose-protein mannosyltransferase